MALDTVGVKYEADVSSLQKGLDEAIQSQTKLGKQAAATGEAINKEGAQAADAMGKTAKATTEATKQQTQFQGALGETQNKLKGVLVAFKAIVANPIVLTITALVGVFVALYKSFAATDSGGTKLQGVFSGISAVVDVAMQRVGLLAKGLEALFSGNITEAGSLFKEAVSGVGAQMKNAAAAAYDYEQSLDALNDTWMQFTTDLAINANKIAQLEFKAMDRSLGIEERRAALKEAIQIAEEQLIFEQNHSQQLFEIELDRLAASKNVDKEILKEYITSGTERAAALLKIYPQLAKARENMEAEEKTLRDLYGKVLQTETRFFDENKRNISRMSGFEEQENAKAEERRRKANEKRIADETKRINDEFTLQQLRINVMQDGIGKEIAARDLAYEREKLQFKDNKEALLLIEQKYWQDIDKIRKKYQNDQLLEQQVIDEELVKKQEQTDAIIRDLLKNKTDSLLTEQGRELREIQRHYEDLKMQVGDNEEALTLINEERLRKEAEVNEKYRQLEREKEQELFETRVQIADSTLQALTSIGDLLIEDEQQRAEFMKAMTLFKLGLSTAEAISKATASAAAVPFPGNIAAIAAAVATVLGNMAAAKQALQGAQAPAFKDGVIDLQGPGTGTSDSIPAWLSKGESVMTNRETRTFKDELKAMRAGNYADLITAKYVLPALRAQASDTAQRMATGLKLQASLDDDRIVSQLGRIKPATAKDIERLGSTLARQWKDTAYRNSKSWKA